MKCNTIKLINFKFVVQSSVFHKTDMSLFQNYIHIMNNKYYAVFIAFEPI